MTPPSPIPTPIAAPPVTLPPVAPQLVELVGIQPLTALNPAALPFAQAQECRDPEESKEEAEERRERFASNVIAKVKAFSRRMSQRSLDNLRS